MISIVYKKDDLHDLSDSELMAFLKNAWNVKNDKFEIWGEILPLGENVFSFIRDPYLVATGELLHYPLEGIEHIPCQFFVPPREANKFGSRKQSRFVRCELELSLPKERIKHENPFSLCVKPDSCIQLKKLPVHVPRNILNNDDFDSFINKSIYDFHLEKSLSEINKIIERKENDFTREFEAKKESESRILEEIKNSKLEIEKERDGSIELLEHLNKRQINLKDSIEKLQLDKRMMESEIQSLIHQYEQIEIDMNNKIERLQSFIEKKADFLKKFEFVDQDDLENFILSPSVHHIEKNGLLFNNDFDRNYTEVVSYIQAYLVKKDILYPRHIIENYLTLLRTKDLIILAGDSGSGKTNLVKSFADAVGGKAVIIPVKPNWTSSEDLLGYYNPLEKKYLATPFLNAILDAQKDPDTPYFICLDEMNLARVEYYFADFLSLLESRNKDQEPEIELYADTESSHVLSELKAVVEIIKSAKEKYQQDGITNFIELLKDEELNVYLRQAFGFSDKDSLIKYHSEIRRMLSAVMTMPSTLKIPNNVHIIGAINIDETTHYLSPKILDRAHIMRFESPLLSDWDGILDEVEGYGFENVSKPVIFNIDDLGIRDNYPKFDRLDNFCEIFIELNKDVLHKLGVEFGMRTIRQGLNYIKLFQDVNDDYEMAINNFLLHKVLPKLNFDGNKKFNENTKISLLEIVLLDRIKSLLAEHEYYDDVFSAVHTLENVIKNAKENDNIVNYWS